MALTRASGSRWNSLAECLRRVVAYPRIGERTDRPASSEHVHFHAEPMQGLTELQADHARTEHGHRARQIVPVEHVVVDHQAVACRPQQRRNARRGAGGDHRLCEGDANGLSHLQRVVVEKAGVAAQRVRCGDGIDALEHEPDEAVTLALDPRHDGAAVDLDACRSARSPNSGHRAAACAASAAAISSLLGMHPTRAHVVP